MGKVGRLCEYVLTNSLDTHFTPAEQRIASGVLKFCLSTTKLTLWNSCRFPEIKNQTSKHIQPCGNSLGQKCSKLFLLCRTLQWETRAELQRGRSQEQTPERGWPLSPVGGASAPHTLRRVGASAGWTSFYSVKFSNGLQHHQREFFITQDLYI